MSTGGSVVISRKRGEGKQGRKEEIKDDHDDHEPRRLHRMEWTGSRGE